MTADEWLGRMNHLQKTDPAAYRDEMAAHEAEMVRTAKLHQEEFQRTGKRTVFGPAALDLGPMPAARRPAWGSRPASKPNQKGHNP